MGSSAHSLLHRSVDIGRPKCSKDYQGKMEIPGGGLV